VRGKNILWIALIALIFSSLLVNAGMNFALAAPKTRIYLDPSRLPETPGTMGHPGDEYTVAVKIDDAQNAWSVQFTVKHIPFVSVTVASYFREGDFMSEGDTWPTAFYATTNSFEGTVTFVIFRIGPYGSPGASGSGTLATFKLKVIESGEGPIDIRKTILLAPPSGPGDVVYIPHETAGGHYHGPYSRLVRVNLPEGRKVKSGTTFPIGTKVQNRGDIPMNVTVKCWIQRADDGRTNEIRAGQTYAGGGLGEPRPFEYLYVDEFNEWYYEFNGDASNLFDVPDGNYIEGDANAQWASLYSFEDITLGGREIADIWVEGYTRYPNGPTEAVDIDLYGFSSVSSFAWWGSCYGGTDWGWVGTRWIGGESVYQQQPELGDETELNNVELLVYNYHGDAPDVIQIDSMRLKVEFAGITPVIYLTWELQPDEYRELPDIVWISNEDHEGSYSLVAQIEYSSEFLKWNSWGSEEKDLFFWIVP
jgi:hypothetical protein